jgi:hypothetical protein
MKERIKSFRMIVYLTVILFLLVSAGCATIVSHSNWPIIIRSNPEQADVSITDVKENKKIHEGKTPTTLTLSSYGGYFAGKTYMIQVSKDGFETKTVEVKSELNPWYLGNIIFGGLIGILIVDPLTGAMWKLDPREVEVALPKKISEGPNDQRTNSIVFLQDLPQELRDKLIRIK